MSRYHCPVCGLISPGDVCGNPGCSSWQQQLEETPGDESWVDSLRTLERVTVDYILANRVRPRAAAVPVQVERGRPPETQIRIYDPCGVNWLDLASWKQGPRLGWVPGTVCFSRWGQWQLVPVSARGVDVRVHFLQPERFRNYEGQPIVRSDLRYHEVGSILRDLGNPQGVAHEMLHRVRYGYPSRGYGGFDAFIDGMLVLVFGIECARNWATLSTSLMLLELIAYGGGPHFDLESAFHTDRRWFDGETSFGGTFPMATHGTGPGNLVDRGRILRGELPPWAAYDDPMHHAVIYREVAVLRAWLHMTRDWPAYRDRSLSERIETLLRVYFPPRG